MIAALLVVAAATVAGMVLVNAVDSEASGLLLPGLGFLYGSGALYFTLLVWPRWSGAAVALALIVVVTLSLSLHKTKSGGKPPHSIRALDLLSLLPLAAFAFYATLAAPWQWDYWAIWGLKARVFFEHGGIDWRFLESRWNAFAHADYPLLVPFNMDAVALVTGRWDDRWLGVVYVAWAAAALLVVRGLAARELRPLGASLVTLICASLTFSTFVGTGEGAIIAFGGAGVLFLRSAIRDGDAASLRHAAILLGLAANAKNEGLTLLVASTMAVAMFAPRRLPRLWPAYALAAPWLVLRAAHALATDLASGSVVSRVAARLPFAPHIGALLVRHLPVPWFWVAIVAGLAVARRREWLVPAIVGIQLLFFAAAYFATPYSPAWHIATSWNRLAMQLALPAAFSVALMLAHTIELRHAEARPDE